MLSIDFKNGNHRSYDEEEYTDYEYLRDVFVVMRDTKWIGIYNMAEVSAIEII